MIAWWWLIVALLVGIIIGLWIAGIVRSHTVVPDIDRVG